MSNKAVYQGRLLNVILKKTRLPNGNVVELEVIKHVGAVLIVPFLSRDKILILRQFRPVIDEYLYELPAGTLKPGESLYSCAKRELREETGYIAQKLLKLGYIFPVPGYSTEKIQIYQAKGLRKGQFFPEDDEVIEVFEVTKKIVRELFRTGRIIDAKTISALAFCGWL